MQSFQVITNNQVVVKVLMDAANIRNLFQPRYDRKPSTWSKIGIPHEKLDNIDLDLVVSQSISCANLELPRSTSRHISFKVCSYRQASCLG